MSWLDTLKKHPKITIALLWMLTLCGAGIGGRLTAPKPQPAVQLSEVSDYEGTRNNNVQTQKVEGPVVFKTHTVTKTVPGPTQACGTETTTDTEETHGQVVTTTNDHTTTTEHQKETVDLKITPAPLPGWSFGVAVENPLTDKLLRLQVGRRLLGNLWVQAGAVPARTEWDVGVVYQW